MAILIAGAFTRDLECVLFWVAGARRTLAARVYSVEVVHPRTVQTLVGSGASAGPTPWVAVYRTLSLAFGRTWEGKCWVAVAKLAFLPRTESALPRDTHVVTCGATYAEIELFRAVLAADITFDIADRVGGIRQSFLSNALPTSAGSAVSDSSDEFCSVACRTTGALVEVGNITSSAASQTLRNTPRAVEFGN